VDDVIADRSDRRVLLATCLGSALAPGKSTLLNLMAGAPTGQLPGGAFISDGAQSWPNFLPRWNWRVIAGIQVGQWVFSVLQSFAGAWTVEENVELPFAPRRSRAQRNVPRVVAAKAPRNNVRLASAPGIAPSENFPAASAAA